MIRRGEIWVANFNPTRGNEVGKIRPALVIQADELTRAGAETIVVLPITSQARQGVTHLRVRVSARTRLLKDCFVIVDKPRTLDRRRLGEGPLAALTWDELRAVERGMSAVLGLI